jgi:hypothetical protein
MRFSTSFFFMNQFLQAPEYPIRIVSTFLRKFAKIIANECLSAVSTTPAINCSAVSTTPLTNL